MTGISAGARLTYLATQTSSSTSLVLSYTSATSTYVVQQTDFVIDCTSGTFTVTLPTAAGIVGKQYCIKNSGTGVITVDANGSETIDSSLTFILSVQYESIWIVSDGANWKVI